MGGSKKKLLSFWAETANQCVRGGGDARNILKVSPLRCQETQESGTAAKIGNASSRAGTAGCNCALEGAAPRPGPGRRGRREAPPPRTTATFRANARAPGSFCFWSLRGG